MYTPCHSVANLQGQLKYLEKTETTHAHEQAHRTADVAQHGRRRYLWKLKDLSELHTPVEYVETHESPVKVVQGLVEACCSSVVLGGVNVVCSLCLM